MNQSVKTIKDALGNKPLHELTPNLLLAILDTLLDIDKKLEKCLPRK